MKQQIKSKLNELEKRAGAGGSQLRIIWKDKNGNHTRVIENCPHVAEDTDIVVVQDR